MPRPRRVVLPGIPLHITHRGNNRSTIFFDDEDCSIFSDFLQDAHLEFGCEIHAYVFMSNHFHILITPVSEIGPAKMMHSVGLNYSRHFNRRYGRTGPMWDGPYHSSLIQTSKYFFACSRYIELNPVRALMVNRPEGHSRSSYHYNAEGKSNALITPHEMYSSLGTNDHDRTAAYRALFAAALDPDEVAAIRTGVHRNAATGDSAFRDRLTRLLQQSHTTREDLGSQ